MSTRKFRRLFIVSFVPLLILGVITAQLLFHYSGGKYEYILCKSFMGIDYCHQVGGDPDGNLYKHVKGESPAWFSLPDLYDKSPPLVNFIEASTRVVPDVQIVHASPFVSFGPEVASFMGSLAGRRAMVKLGFQKGERSIISGEDIILYCNTLRFKAMEGEYSSHCYGKGWGGNVTYRATGVSRDELDKLLAAINKAVDSRSWDYNIYRAVMYPIYVYLFLLVSFFAWVFLKAVRFVKNG